MGEANEGTSVRYCVIMPAYNEERHILDTVKSVREKGFDVVVVDDGSSDQTVERAREAGAIVVQQARNMGKGEALQAGFRYAEEAGYDAVITMDSDGQHLPDDLVNFTSCHETTGAKAVIGNRMDETDDMPFIRKATNRTMSRWLSRIMHQEVPDTQNGYRLYACEILPLVGSRSKGFAAESEVLLHLAENDIIIASVPVQTVYGDESSKINPFKDTWRFFRMLFKYFWYRKK
jgi:glycosyltransferase involved in cell wall biosynthesis